MHICLPMVDTIQICIWNHSMPNSKKNYLNRVNQRSDFVLHQLIQFDKDEQEEEIRRKMFGRKRNRRSAKVLKCHKLAAQDWKQLKYKIKCSIAKDGQKQFIFENEKTPIVVTQLKCDPLHKCIYTCPECHSCTHHYLCSCESRRVQRDYCIHLCAVGQDKKVLFGLDEQDLKQIERLMKRAMMTLIVLTTSIFLMISIALKILVDMKRMMHPKQKQLSRDQQ